MENPIHRSLLILPANVQKFVEEAYRRGADAVALDLEDSVPEVEKNNARGGIRSAIELAGKGGADVLVRVNNEPMHIVDDLEAAVFPGLHGIFLPKTETAAQARLVSDIIHKLELDGKLPESSVRLSVHIESPRGLLNLKEIAEADSRIESMSIGVDDYCLELGIDPSADGSELFLLFSMMVNVCKANRVRPMGIYGSVADFRNLSGFRSAAERARSLGAEGAYCIHPDQVGILNEVFTPAPHEVEQARRVIDVFEKALANGRASTSLDGKMIDTPVYKRAKRVLDRRQYFSVLDQRKNEALAKSMSR